MIETFTISDLAREFDITTRTIRFYEDKGLLSPERRGQSRIYTQRDRTRVLMILRGKRLGFSLDEVNEIISLYDESPGEVGQLNFFLGKIADRQAQLKSQRDDIDLTLDDLDAAAKRARDHLAEITGSKKKTG